MKNLQLLYSRIDDVQMHAADRRDARASLEQADRVGRVLVRAVRAVIYLG